VNIKSIINVLDICLSSRIKHLHYASTMGIFPQYFCEFSNEFSEAMVKDNMQPEISQMMKVFPLNVIGYPWGKLVVEESLIYAYSRGLPIGIYRIPPTGINASTGYTQSSDIAVSLRTAVMQTMSAPRGFSFQWTEPLDVITSMIANISLNNNRKNVVYHCCHPVPYQKNGSIIDELGLSIQTVNYSEFKKRCLALGKLSPLKNYWPLIDYFSKCWFYYNQRADSPLIEVNTVLEDFDGDLEWPTLETELKNSLEWIKNSESWPYPIPGINNFFSNSSIRKHTN